MLLHGAYTWGLKRPTVTLQEADGMRSGHVLLLGMEPKDSEANCISAKSRWQAEWIRVFTVRQTRRLKQLLAPLQKADGNRDRYVL